MGSGHGGHRAHSRLLKIVQEFAACIACIACSWTAQAIVDNAITTIHGGGRERKRHVWPLRYIRNAPSNYVSLRPATGEQRFPDCHTDKDSRGALVPRKIAEM